MQAIRVRTANNPPPGTQGRGIAQELPLADVQGPPGTNKWLNGQRYFHNHDANATQAYDNSLPLIPGQGYWVQSFIECELIIPKP